MARNRTPRWLVPCLLGFSLHAGAVHADPIRIGGAGTTLGTMKELGEAFEKVNRSAKVSVDAKSKASVGGVRSLLRGELDIAVSTRKLTDADVQGLSKLSTSEIARVPFVFAIHAATKEVAVSSAQLLQIYQFKKATWSDGSKIFIFPRTGDVSDTLFLMDISPEWKAAVQAITADSQMQKYATAQQAAELVERTPGGLTTSTLALLQTENRKMRALHIDGVEPTAATVETGRYQYYKPVILVTAAPRPADVQRFVDFVCSPAGRKILANTGHVVIVKKNEKC